MKAPKKYLFYALFLKILDKIFALYDNYFMDCGKLRKDIISRREGLSEREVLDCSKPVFDALFAMPEVNSAEVFFVYKSFRGEIDTNKIIATLKNMGKTVLVPLIANGEMLAVLPEGDNFVLDGFGVEIPEKYSLGIKPDVTVTPLVACDENKNRVGFGKGFYDRFFSKNDCLKIGVCYDFQVVNSISPKPWDIPLDVIITEKRVIL